MTIVVFDPVGDVERPEQRPEQVLERLEGRRVGYVFNQHTSALVFWKAFESEVESRLVPESVHRIYKTNTWAQAPKAEIDRLVGETDFALIGVGA